MLLFAHTLAMDTEPSALTVQPTQPAGHSHAEAGEEALHTSTVEAENDTVRDGLHSAGAEGPLQVMSGATATIATVSEHVATLPLLSTAWQLTTRPLSASHAGTEKLPSLLAVHPDPAPAAAVHTA